MVSLTKKTIVASAVVALLGSSSNTKTMVAAEQDVNKFDKYNEATG
mgnify:CR=1 FL=1